MTTIAILNEDFEMVAVKDVYQSLIWAERYDEHGDFVLELPSDDIFDPYLVAGNWLSIPESERLMRIDKITPIFDDEEGTKLRLEGESAEALLKLRVTDDITQVSGEAQISIIHIMNDHIIVPSNAAREIPNLVFIQNVDLNTGYSFTNQYEVGYVYDIVRDICVQMGWGFKFTLNHTTRNLEFRLVEGKDLSNTQAINSRVIFSDDFDNVLSSSFLTSVRPYKNVITVVTNDELLPYTRNIWNGVEPSGWQRREHYISQTPSRSVPSGPDLTDNEMEDVLESKAKEELANLGTTSIVDGEFDIEKPFQFNVDFFMGDIVQVIVLGNDAPARITEHILSFDQEGTSSYVSFTF